MECIYSQNYYIRPFTQYDKKVGSYYLKILAIISCCLGQLFSMTDNVKPPTPIIEENDPKKDFFLDICLKGANNLRTILRMDDTSYTRVFFTAHQDARKYYIYGILDELEKAGVALMGYQEVLKDTSGDTHDRVSRNVIASIVDQQMVWIRKLTEILAELLLFSKTNIQEYYRHYLLVNHLSDLKKVISDTKEFFASENLNHKHQKEEAINEIQQLEAKLNHASCWYLASKKGGGKHAGDKGLLASFKGKLQQSYLIANPDQKLTLGITYENTYGRSSRSLHPNLVRPDPEMGVKNIEIGIAQIGTLAAHILILCRKLLKDRRKKGIVAQLARVFRKNKYPDKLLKSRVNPSIKKGDFVIAYGDIAEVIKINKSKYGYRSFKVKYLSSPPLAHIPIDTFPAMFVRKFYERKLIADQVKQKINKSSPKMTVNNKQVANSLRKTMADMWEKFGFKETYYGRPDLAHKKITESLKQMKAGMSERK